MRHPSPPGKGRRWPEASPLHDMAWHGPLNLLHARTGVGMHARMPGCMVACDVGRPPGVAWRGMATCLCGAHLLCVASPMRRCSAAALRSMPGCTSTTRMPSSHATAATAADLPAPCGPASANTVVRPARSAGGRQAGGRGHRNKEVPHASSQAATNAYNKREITASYRMHVQYAHRLHKERAAL